MHRLTALAITGTASIVLAMQLVFATGIVAQEVRGRVSAAETGEPLPGAFVLLLDSAGERRAAGLAGTDGGFRVSIDASGVYRLRVEMLGYATHEEEVRELLTDEVVVRDVRLSIAPVMLEGITAAGESRCGLRRDEGSEVQRVWDEARKALSVADWLSASGQLVYQVDRFERTRDVVTDALRDEQPHLRRQLSGTGKVPFRTAPLDALAAAGYVQATSDGGYQYFGVDAAVLLSDGFLETHCFRLVRDGDDGRRRVGLEFSPLPSRSLPDIEGVIWLDAATFGPLHVEYTFTHHLRAFDVPEERFGGRTEFERLDNGAWVTSRWLLRMPDFVETTRNRPSFAQPRTPAGSRDRLITARDAGLIVNEQGGDLVFVRVPTGERGRGEVRGVVWDSTRSRPLARATVYAANGGSTDVTDASGRFRLTGLPVGSNAVGFIHPWADSLALRGHMVDVEVGQAPATVTLGIPKEAFCSEESLTFLEDDGVTFEVPSGGLVGFAEDAETGLPVAGVRIEADWEVRGRWRLRDALRGIGPEKPRGDEIVTDASGRFLVCPVPLGNTLRIRAAGGRRLTIEMARRLMHANVVVR